MNEGYLAMAADSQYETEANDWIEGLITDLAGEPSHTHQPQPRSMHNKLAHGEVIHSNNQTQSNLPQFPAESIAPHTKAHASARALRPVQTSFDANLVSA